MVIKTRQQGIQLTCSPIRHFTPGLDTETMENRWIGYQEYRCGQDGIWHKYGDFVEAVPAASNTETK